jgi:hypothetical protein
MEINNENICVCDTCEIPSDFGKETFCDANAYEAYKVYEHGIFYGSREIDDTYLCNDCA